MGESPRWEPGERFARALQFAIKYHGSQARKGTGTPYIAHLLAVCALVIEDPESTEDEAIAALLHDAAEDAGGQETLDEIGREFGADVKRIVDACSDTFKKPKPKWRPRKERYLAAIEHKRDDELRVSLADKVHNARSILTDYRSHGESMFERFDPESDQLWYYRELADAFAEKLSGPLVEELERVVSELEAEVRPMNARYALLYRVAWPWRLSVSTLRKCKSAIPSPGGYDSPEERRR